MENFHEFKSSCVQIFPVHISRFLFRGSYFRVLVVGGENRENLDLAKISGYTVSLFEQGAPKPAGIEEEQTGLEGILEDCHDYEPELQICQ